jgi:uncharacterized ferritin-like protein (DUF455 family)
MELHLIAKNILFEGDLESKLIDRSFIDLKNIDKNYNGASIPQLPARAADIKIGHEQVKFPRSRSLADQKRRGLALHFFANHELLAIEMLAAAIYKFPCLNDEDVAFKKSLYSTLVDEQKHLRLYIARMKDFGVEFGDYPLNDFFWRSIRDVETPHQFLSVMALTFESANLDFSRYYAQVFEKLGDHKSAEIMNEIYRDEISHVAVGAHWLKKWRGDRDLWNYYLSGLPSLLTPARAKGIIFEKQAREKAGLDKDFIYQLGNYRDEFQITARKEWK